MNKLLLSLLIVMIAATAFSQSAVEGRAEFQKTKYRAAVLDVPYPQDQVEEAFDKYMRSKGSPGSNTKGYRLYRNVKFSKRGSFYGDMYVSIDKKSRRDKESSSISVIVSRPNESLTNKSADDDYGVVESKEFLNDMVSEIQDHNLEVEIAKQEDEIKKAEKKYKEVEDANEEMNKKIQDLNDRIAKNTTDLKAQQEEIEKNKKILESLKGKRKN